MRRRRRRLTNRQVGVLFGVALLASSGGIAWYGIATGDQPDLICTHSVKSGTPQPGSCYPDTTEAGHG